MVLGFGIWVLSNLVNAKVVCNNSHNYDEDQVCALMVVTVKWVE